MSKARSVSEGKKAFKKRKALTRKHLKKNLDSLDKQKFEPVAAAPVIEYRLDKVVDGVTDKSASFELDEYIFERLCDFRAIMDARCCSATTPIEEFIIGLHYHNRRALTPELIQRDLDTAKVDFNDMIRDAKKFTSQYPEIFASEPSPTQEP